MPLNNAPAAHPVSATALFEHVASRVTAVPWDAQVPGLAIERAFPSSEGWARLSATPTTLLHSLTGDAHPAERVLSLSFYAYARPGQAVGLILDPFAADYPSRASGRSPRLAHWRSLHPDKRRVLLVKAFDGALIAPHPTGLLAAVHDRAAHDPDPDVRVIWRTRTTSLLGDLMAHESLDETERASLHTMAALGAFA